MPKEEEPEGSEEEEDEEGSERYAWWLDTDPEAYFVVVNQTEKPIRKGEQALFCYGRRSNFFLLMNYGFALSDNLYNALSFRLRDALNPTKLVTDYASLLVSRKDPMQEDRNVESYTTTVRLKRNRLSAKLLGYLRLNASCICPGTDAGSLLFNALPLLPAYVGVLQELK